MPPRDEKPNPSELQKAEALIHDETFIALVHTASDAHEQLLRDRAGEVNYEDMTPDLKRELADLEIIKLLLTTEPSEMSMVYKITTTPNASYIKLARVQEIKGDRIALREGDQIRGQTNPVHQLSIKVVKPRPLDPYRASPEAIVVNQPKAVVNITPEEVYLEGGAVKFTAGTGITLKFFEGGCAEVYGSKSAGDINYKTDEPITSIDDDSIAGIVEKLPGI